MTIVNNKEQDKAKALAHQHLFKTIIVIQFDGWYIGPWKTSKKVKQ